MVNNPNIKRIAGTLRYGWFDGANTLLVWVLYGSICAICLSGLVLVLVYTSFDYVDGDINTTMFAIYILSEIIGFMCFPMVLLYILVKNEKHRKKILLWLEDAIELDAYSHKLGEIHTLISPTIYKIQVEFTFDNKQVFLESMGKHIGGGVPIGYQRVWKDYLDKRIKILYSPKYNEIMVLKL